MGKLHGCDGVWPRAPVVPSRRSHSCGGAGYWEATGDDLRILRGRGREAAAPTFVSDADRGGDRTGHKRPDKAGPARKVDFVRVRKGSSRPTKATAPSSPRSSPRAKAARPSTKARPSTPLPTQSHAHRHLPVVWKDWFATLSPDAGPPRTFWISDVPYTQYFSGPFALHAAYWHEDFGEMKSAGA